MNVRSLTKKQRAKLKDLLEEQRQVIIRSLGEKTAQISFHQTEWKDTVDEANENISLSHTARFTNRENLYLKKIFNSLEKMKVNIYGQCEECGVNIPFERLRARLTSDYCIDCKEESEARENQSTLGQKHKHKSLGKTMTLQ